MAKKSSTSSKPHVNIGTIGHVDHGKLTLQPPLPQFWLIRVLLNYVHLIQSDNAPEEKERGITINTAHVEYATANRHYAHVDCPVTLTT